MGDEYVTRDYCERHMDEIEEKLNNGVHALESRISETAVKFAALEESVRSMKGTLNLILGAVVSGMGSIVVILLTRGM